jgi:N-acetyl-anhydromuramyl-L-alanine amidase AmpD
MDKIWAHIIGGWAGHLGKPRGVKLVNPSAEYVRQVRAAIGPQALIIVRFETWRTPLNKGVPENSALDWWNTHRAAIAAMTDGGRDRQVAFEGRNEVPDDLAEWYVWEEVARLRLLRQNNCRGCAGNFSVGCPDLPLWTRWYAPLVEAVRDGWHVLGLHEYWIDTGDISNTWHCARWSMVPALADVPIVVTECGRDVVEGRGQPGWQRTCDRTQYLVDLELYASVLDRYHNVLGATVFTVGQLADPQWRAFDAAPVWPSVVARYSVPQTYPCVQHVPNPVQPRTQYGPHPAVRYWHSDRHGHKPAHIVIHDTEGPASAALSWWSSPSNPYKSSAHYLVRANGEVVPVVPVQWAAHHCGGSTIPGVPAGSVGGTAIVNLVSIGIELEYPAAPASPPWPQVQVDAAVELVRGLARTYQIPRERVLRHADIDAGRRDPRNLDWQSFLDKVFGAQEADVESEILKAAWAAMKVPYNSLAAFPRAARANDLGAPLLPERDIVIGGVTYRYQPFARGVVYAKVGDWGNCKIIKW